MNNILFHNTGISKKISMLWKMAKCVSEIRIRIYCNADPGGLS